MSFELRKLGVKFNATILDLLGTGSKIEHLRMPKVCDTVHFQLHRQSWPFNQIVNCLVRLAIINHVDCRFKFQSEDALSLERATLTLPIMLTTEL